MRKFRKLAAGMLLAMLVLSAAGCGNSDDKTTDNNTTTQDNTTEDTTDGTMNDTNDSMEIGRAHV